jgi:hypothetical protein
MRDTRGEALIQRSSMSWILRLSPLLAISRLHNLEHPTLGLSPCELSSSRDPSISATCPPQMDGPDPLATSLLVKSKDFLLWLPVSESPIERIPRHVSALRSLCCPSREVLNLVQLSTDPTTIGCLNQDLMAQTCPMLYNLPLLLGRGKTNGPNTPTDLGDLRSQFLRYSQRRRKNGLRHLAPLCIPPI